MIVQYMLSKMLRCAVLRRADARKRTIAAQYTKAYGDGAGLTEEFGGWEHEGTWPE